jgi:hypothetical protein
MERELKNLPLNPVRDYTPISSPGAIGSFIESTIYTDFINELALRIEQLRDYNEVCDSKKYLETRGAIAALRLVGDIFQDLMQNAMTDNITPNEEEIEDAD